MNQSSLTDSKKPRVLKRAIKQLNEALKVYDEYDSIRCDPKEYTAIEYWLLDDGDEAFDTLEMFREKLERSLMLGTEKISMTKGETKKDLGALPKSSNPDMKSESLNKGGFTTNTEGVIQRDTRNTTRQEILSLKQSNASRVTHASSHSIQNQLMGEKRCRLH